MTTAEFSTYRTGKIILSAIAIGLVLFLFDACTQSEKNNADISVSNKIESSVSSSENSQQPSENLSAQSETNEVNSMKMTVGDKNFSVTLENNTTVSELRKLLPMTLEMSELNGNEKYNYLGTSLPTAQQNVGNISEGDIMLFGDNCLVVFYKSFQTSYQYTKIGHIDNIDGLAKVLGNGSVTVTFE